MKEAAIKDRASRRLAPVDWLTIGYLGATLALLVAFPRRIPEALPLGLSHLAGILGLVALRRTSFAGWLPGRILLDFYPLVVFPLFYSEIGGLDRLLHDGAFFDAQIQQVEAALFGGQPSQYLCRRLPYAPLGEYLHLGYFSYYFLLPVLALALWFRRARMAFEQTMACVALSFYVSFAFFITIPVTGPYHAFVPPEASAVGILLPRVTRWILDQGSALGSAFPSSHVAVSVTVWIMAMRYHRRLAAIYAFLVPALALGAVYGGYHYATDIVAGALLGILVGTAGHRALAVLFRT